MEKLCLRCGGSDLEPGTLRPGESLAAHVTLRLERVSELTFDTTRLDIEAAVCVQCGQLDLRCDPAKARRLLERHGKDRK